MRKSVFLYMLLVVYLSDGTGWAYRGLQLKGEASRLKDAHIQQTVIDAHKLTLPYAMHTR
mgnify:FL=1